MKLSKEEIIKNRKYLVKAWNAIASGEVEHSQGAWFCGTNRCLGGWAEHFRALDNGIDLSKATSYGEAWKELEKRKDDSLSYSNGISTERYEVMFGFTYEIAETLFKPELTLSEMHEAMLSIFIGTDEEIAKPTSV